MEKVRETNEQDYNYIAEMESLEQQQNKRRYKRRLNKAKKQKLRR